MADAEWKDRIYHWRESCRSTLPPVGWRLAYGFVTLEQLTPAEALAMISPMPPGTAWGRAEYGGSKVLGSACGRR